MELADGRDTRYIGEQAGKSWHGTSEPDALLTVAPFVVSEALAPNESALGFESRQGSLHGHVHFGQLGCGSYDINGTGKDCTLLRGDPDIAGKGIIVSFFLPSALVIFFGILFAILFSIQRCFVNRRIRNYYSNHPEAISKLRKECHNWADGLILAITDAQLFLILAFGVAWHAAAKCDISTYHCLIAIRMALTGIATATLAGFITKGYYTHRLTTLARLGILGYCIWSLFFLWMSLINDNIDTTVFGLLPTREKRDSVLVLPAYCHLDNTMQPFQNLTLEQQNTVNIKGGRDSSFPIFVCGLTVLWCILAFPVVWNMIACLLGPICGHWSMLRNPSDITFFKLSAWVFCMAVCIRNLISVLTLRDWIDRSHWLHREAPGQNIENNINTIGQMAPLIALGATVFTLSDKLSRLVRKLVFCYSPKLFPERECCVDCGDCQKCCTDCAACKKCYGGGNGNRIFSANGWANYSQDSEGRLVGQGRFHNQGVGYNTSTPYASYEMISPTHGIIPTYQRQGSMGHH
ncbi:hypothetical protein PG999_007663 [Apiospora kogelbergensis]|uniref:Uncharacterized protein n=1 Tax=Apiospora kogelbergensis TaxID=1337665 RepID=A0AAW0QU70_9PEZI